MDYGRFPLGTARFVQGMSFGSIRDVKGKHLKRIWELEYPEEAEISLDRL